MFKSISLITLIALLYACTDTASENIRSSGIYAKYEVISDGYHSQVVASYRVGQNSNTYLDLGGGDQVYADNGSQMKILAKRTEIFGAIEYVTDYYGDPGGTFYTLTLERPAENQILVSSASLPLDFDIEPVATSYQAGDVVQINWNPADPQASTQVKLIGSCIYIQTINLPSGSSGVKLLPGNYLSNPQSPGSCQITGSVSRWRVSAVDRGFGAGGRFVTKQVRNFSFNLNY